MAITSGKHTKSKLKLLVCIYLNHTCNRACALGPLSSPFFLPSFVDDFKVGRFLDPQELRECRENPLHVVHYFWHQLQGHLDSVGISQRPCFSYRLRKNWNDLNKDVWIQLQMYTFKYITQIQPECTLFTSFPTYHVITKAMSCDVS